MMTLVRVVAAAAAAVLMAGCASSPAPPAVAADPSVLRVGVSANSPPMVFKQGQDVVGVEADLAAALGRELGRRVVFIETDREKLIDALCDNRIDIIMSAMSVTPARSYRVGFTMPYLRVGQMALARGNEKNKYLLGRTLQPGNGVGVKPGTTAEIFVREEFPNVKCKYYPSGEEGADGLLKEQIDMFISDAPMIWYLAGMYETKGLAVVPTTFTQEELAWGLRRSDTQLLAAANAFLQKAQANGELTRTFGKWMPGFQ